MTRVIIRPASKHRPKRLSMSLLGGITGRSQRRSARPLRLLATRALFALGVLLLFTRLFPRNGGKGVRGSSSTFSFFRRPDRSRVTLGDGWSFGSYLDYHLPLNMTEEEQAAHVQFATNLESGISPPPLRQPYHLWLTVVDSHSLIEARGLTKFWAAQNQQRALAEEKQVHVVALCTDEDCVTECHKYEKDMYCYGGFSLTVPDYWNAIDWTKASGVREALETGRDVLLVTDTIFNKDPYPILERLFDVADIIIPENATNIDSGHLCTNLIWMRSSVEAIELWYGVLERIANVTIEAAAAQVEEPFTITVQEAFNEVLPSVELRVTDEFAEVRLRSFFNTISGLRVHVLEHSPRGIMPLDLSFKLDADQAPEDLYSDAVGVLMPCVEDGELRAFLAKYYGMWPDVDHIYSMPRSTLRLNSLVGSRGAVTQQLRVVLTICRYSHRAFEPPAMVTFTDMDVTLPIWRAFPLSQLAAVWWVRIHEPGFSKHAAPYLIASQGSTQILESQAELDIRNTPRIEDLLNRLESSAYMSEQTITLIGFELFLLSDWRQWKVPQAVNKLNVCKYPALAPTCGQICRGNLAQLRKGKKWPSQAKFLKEAADDDLLAF